MEQIKEVSSFSRNLYNLEKMGAYYTPVEVCKRISYLFAFPEGEFNAYDPTCGDGEALLAVVGHTKANTLGCELNEKVAKETDEKFRSRGSGFVVNCDFFAELKSTYNVFDFCFANPPYMADHEGKRLETKCIEKMYGLQRKGSYVAVVVPFGIVSNANTKVFLKSWVERYVTEAVYRFDDKDYEQFHQVVFIGQKRNMLLSNPLYDAAVTLDGETERIYSEVKELEKLPYLPKNAEDVPPEDRLPIKESKLSDIKFFTTQTFDVEKARTELWRSPLTAKFGELATTEEFGVVRVGNPPIPLGKDHMYLSAVAGAGMGFCGNAEEGTLHLQRGITKKAEQEEVAPSEGGGSKVKITVTSYIKTGINVIQADGTISQLV